ncbi:MAG: hypothetical protein E4H33_00655, partial [Anaerolineales bacterium]
MDEPSVLDYVREKLAFWRKSSLTIPPADEKPLLPEHESGSGSIQSHSWKKYLIFLPSLFAITAQIFGEPDHRSRVLVIFFYTAAAGSLVLLTLFRN